MMHHLLSDESIILVRSDILVRFVLLSDQPLTGSTSRGLKGFATRLTVEAYSLAANAATYAHLSTDVVFVTAILNRSTYSISSAPRCNKLVHSLKLTGRV